MYHSFFKEGIDNAPAELLEVDRGELERDLTTLGRSGPPNSGHGNGRSHY